MFWNSSIYSKLSALSAYFPFEEQARDLLACSHFHSFLILHFIYYISQRSYAKNCFRITGYSVKIRDQEQTITRAILSRNQWPSVSNSQRGWSCEQIFDCSRSTKVLNPLVGTNLLYGKRTVGFFPHASHALRALLRHALPISLLILRKKKQLFCSLPVPSIQDGYPENKDENPNEDQSRYRSGHIWSPKEIMLEQATQEEVQWFLFA